MKEKPKSLTLYATLQALTLVFCWGWFAVLWTIAFFNYSLEQFEWWVLVATACAGLYGLRPNLEKAIDIAWLGAKPTPAGIAERAAQLKPIKRRIDFIFSLVVIALLLASAAAWFLLGGIDGIGT